MTTIETRKLLAIGALLLAVFGAAATARADVRTEARQHFRAGMRAVAAGEVERGIAELEQAYELLPHPNVLYNIAQAYQTAGTLDKSIEYFARYLESDPPDRAEVEGFLAALRARVAERQAAAHPTQPAASLESTPAEGGAAVATEVEIQAIEASATQLNALADATESDALRRRAEGLRALATALRTRRASPATPGPVGPVDGTEAPPVTQPVVPEPASAAAPLGETRGDDVYAESVVSASRTAQSPLDAPNSTTIITAQDIRLTGLTSLGDLLRRVAGVDVMRLTPGDTQFSIRGLNQRFSNKVIVLLDGRSVYLDFLGTTQSDTLPFNLEDVERIEVIRGPASALYGADAVTGIVNIITRDPGEGRAYAALSGGNDGVGRAVGGVTARSGGLSYRLSMGYAQAFNYAAVVDPRRVDVLPASGSPYGLMNVWFNGDFRYQLGHGYQLRFGNATQTGSSTMQGVSRLRQIESAGQVFSQTYAQLNTPIGLQLRTFWNGFGTTATVDEQVTGAIPTTADDIVQHIVDVEATYAHRFGTSFRNDITAGLAYRYKYIDWVWLGPQVNTQHHFAAYLQDQMRIIKGLQLVVSARLDSHPLLAAIQVSPRASVVVRPSRGQAFRATVGRAFRGPTFLESYLNIDNNSPLRGVTALGAGNTKLRPEEMLSAEIGYANQASDYFALEVNGYFNLVSDLISLSSVDTYRLRDTDGAGAEAGGAIPAGGFIGAVDAFPVGVLRYQNLGLLASTGQGAQFRQLGAEVGVRVFPLDGLDVYANYALSDTAPNNLTAVEAQQRLRGFEADQRTSLHKVNVGVQYRSRFGLDVSTDFHWVSSQLWVEQVSDVATGVAFQSFALPNYAVLDARVGYRLGTHLEFGIVGTNLLSSGVRQHPFAQPIDRRVWGSVTARF